MFDHGLLEQFPVVSDLYALDSRPENLHVVFRENTPLCKFDATVEGRLSPETEKDTIGLFFGDNFLEKVRPYRNRIHLVRELLVRVNSCNIWIDDDCSNPLFSKGLDCLGRRVVKLASFPNLDSTTSHNDDRFDAIYLQAFKASSKNLSKRNLVSYGPGELSGCH